MNDRRKGGEARAKSLTPDERKAIAQVAASARWGKKEVATDLPKATHQGKMIVGEVELDCYVLADGRRLIHKRGMAKALNLKSAGGNAFLRSMTRKGIGSELGQKLVEIIENPVIFKPLTLDSAHGYDAEVLVEVCKAIVRADEGGKLTNSQDFLAAQARILLNAFAKVGVAALIDEATGFQEVRGPDALRLLVQQYVEAEKREWEKQFPDEYYDRLNELYGSKRMTRTSTGIVIQNRPQHFALFTRKYVYHPLENGAVLDELDQLNPKVDRRGNRRARFHQHLSFDYGIQKLKRQMQEVMTLMAISDNVSQFKRLFQKRFPQVGDQGDFGLE
ncbi:hypothetical protein HHL26_06830 [Sphingobium sp. TB-6]|uniref:P63C domain-containing protein n=1 Tax=Sphingobium sp. TB-6 TaxID=2728850 RepID=UPI00146BEB77|nr:P63C domain-containing protein [Sphingobium sp. TB-6]NML88781.1 hypothetical protein [Sphingobium sp. TB-6]